jgi:hypothetical protein
VYLHTTITQTHNWNCLRCSTPFRATNTGEKKQALTSTRWPSLTFLSNNSRSAKVIDFTFFFGACGADETGWVTFLESDDRWGAKRMGSFSGSISIESLPNLRGASTSMSTSASGTSGTFSSSTLSLSSSSLSMRPCMCLLSLRQRQRHIKHCANGMRAKKGGKGRKNGRLNRIFTWDAAARTRDW